MGLSYSFRLVRFGKYIFLNDLAFVIKLLSSLLDSYISISIWCWLHSVYRGLQLYLYRCHSKRGFWVLENKWDLFPWWFRGNSFHLLCCWYLLNQKDSGILQVDMFSQIFFISHYCHLPSSTFIIPYLSSHCGIYLRSSLLWLINFMPIFPFLLPISTQYSSSSLF